MSLIKQLLEMPSDMDINYANAGNPEDYSPENEEQSGQGFHVDIETETTENSNFRKVLFTTEKTQLVLMSLNPGEDIGEETHDGDQFFRFEAGVGQIIIGEDTFEVKDGDAAVVPQGVVHNVINTSDSEDLRLYALYAPPQHEDGTVDEEKPVNDEH